MTSTTIRIDALRTRVRLRDCRGFTLTEVIVGASLSVIVLAGVLSTFLMLGRNGANVANYSMSETQIRRAIEEFSQDVRMANAITTNNASSITLTVPDNYAANGNQVTYVFDSATTGPTAGCFYRMPGGPSSLATKSIQVSNVSSFALERFNRLDTATTSDTEAKRVQITLNVRRTRTTLVAANTILVSASYIIRNKAVH